MDNNERHHLSAYIPFNHSWPKRFGRTEEARMQSLLIASRKMWMRTRTRQNKGDTEVIIDATHIFRRLAGSTATQICWCELAKNRGEWCTSCTGCTCCTATMKIPSSCPETIPFVVYPTRSKRAKASAKLTANTLVPFRPDISPDSLLLTTLSQEEKEHRELLANYVYKVFHKTLVGNNRATRIWKIFSRLSH